MATLSQGSSYQFTAQAEGATVTLSVNGGSIASWSGAAAGAIGPIPARINIGPLGFGQTVTISANVGEAFIEFGDVSPGVHGGGLPATVNSRGQLVGPNGVVSPTIPGVLRCAVFGSSTDQHCYANAEGSLVVSNGVGTWTSTQGNHNLQSGCRVSLNKDAPSTDFQRNTATAIATRINATTLRMDLPDWPDGTGVMDCHFLTAYAQPSWVRKLRSLSGGSLDFVATLAVGGEQTGVKLGYWRQLLDLDINCVIGAFGIGNDLLGDIDPSVTIANMTTMINGLTGAGLVVVVLLPPATSNMTTAQGAAGQKIIAAMMALRASNPLLFLADEYSATINPATGQGQSGLFIGDGVHLNRKGKDLVATNAHYPAIQSILARPISRLISNVNDCTSKEATNPQAMTGFWLNTGTTASTLSGKATGTVDANITSISVAGSGSALNCSLAARADGYGYDQVLEFVPGGNNQSYQIDLTGFHTYLTAGEYFVGCALSITIDAGLEVLGYAHYITANVAGANGRLTENYRTENGVNNEPAMTTSIVEDPCLFPNAIVTAAPSSAAWVFALSTGTLASAGLKVTVKIGRPTIRPV